MSYSAILLIDAALVVVEGNGPDTPYGDHEPVAAGAASSGASESAGPPRTRGESAERARATGLMEIVAWCEDRGVEPVVMQHARSRAVGEVVRSLGARVIDLPPDIDSERAPRDGGERDWAPWAQLLVGSTGLTLDDCVLLSSGRGAPSCGNVAMTIGVGRADIVSGTVDVEVQGTGPDSALPALEAWMEARGLARAAVRRETPLSTLLPEMLAVDAPAQLVDNLLPTLVRACRAFDLPAPTWIGGNLVVGELDSAEVILSAHVDEASFVVSHIADGVLHLAPCHRLAEPFGSRMVRVVGVRHGVTTTVGEAVVTRGEDGRLRCRGMPGARLGDRAVYADQPAWTDGLLSGKAIDDRVGALASLAAMAELERLGVKASVVLSDGEQSLPDGYFSRTFPAILRHIRRGAFVVFVSGIFDEGLAREGVHGPLPDALVVPHSADGKGYLVPPGIFAVLRDVVVPAARAGGLAMRVSSAYQSRGDDWGLVTNPVLASEVEACFVSFGGGGTDPGVRVVDPRAVENAAAAAALVAAVMRRGSSVRQLCERQSRQR